MKQPTFSAIVLAIAALTAACSSMPTSTSLLTRTHSDYVDAQTNPDIARYAPLEMKQAGEALAQADAAADDKDSKEKVDKLYEEAEAATETMGFAGGSAPSEPRKPRLEKLKIPPSSPTMR